MHGPDLDSGGGISDQVKGLDEHPQFASAIDLVDAGGDLSAFISNLTEACLREFGINSNPVYLVAAQDVSERVGTV
jgi:hypothetical protein